jgi:predicted dehydrogenase
MAGSSLRRTRDQALRHYDWHWLWHWGNGELGNNGIHHLDILRWGLQVEYPQRVTYNGGRYAFDDKQETPDTGTAVFDFGHVGMEWVQSSCHPRSAEKPLGECVFYGDDGTFAISGSAWTIYDGKGAKIGEGKGPGGGDAAHMGNFLESVRGNAQLNSPIEEGQNSTMLCHLGNIAYRTNTVVRCDPKQANSSTIPREKNFGAASIAKGGSRQFDAGDPHGFYICLAERLANASDRPESFRVRLGKG